MITTIIFDLSEVYLNGLFGAEKRLSQILNIKEEKILNNFNNRFLTSLFKGKISEEKYLKALIDENSWKISLDNLKEIIRENFKEVEGVREIIEDLKNKNFKLGLLSIHSKEWIEYCENKFNFHKLFDSISYSFENSLLKPEKKAFINILNKLNAKAEECLFIDDSKKNVASSRKMGIQSILFKGANELRNDLKKCLENNQNSV